ncbi:hypothetical protein HW452_16795 [Halomonas aquamarina]|uniref:Uncharacterized protein n=1 Tax=Vreelandella aquamarina TaxID=77097 RepID=A0ACC5VZ89_9GAMM|nr:hypothetical protein [Halomonas aquamarina]MBZ5489180.1 hypothetical protein [Halomonas aquamarina]
MTQPTHTHRTLGGGYVEIQQYQGTGPLAGQWLVAYTDLIKGIDSVTTQTDWTTHWRELRPDDCAVCYGTGRDHIKGNPDKPCGGCYGLGRVRKDGETPLDLWALSDVAQRIIIELEGDLQEFQEAMAVPGVRELVERERQQRIEDSIAQKEQEWAAGLGFGPGGQRYTGD